MRAYVSLPRVRADITKAVRRILKRAGIDGAISVDVNHPERVGGKHGVRVAVDRDTSSEVN